MHGPQDRLSCGPDTQPWSLLWAQHHSAAEMPWEAQESLSKAVMGRLLVFQLIKSIFFLTKNNS